MVSIMVLLTLIIFLYAIIGVKSFGENDPAHFGTLPVAMLTLFVAVTLSDWSHMYQIAYKGCDNAPRLSRSLHILEELLTVAKWSAVRPSLSRSLTRAPASSSRTAALQWRRAAAVCSGVQP